VNSRATSGASDRSSGLTSSVMIGDPEPDNRESSPCPISPPAPVMRTTGLRKLGRLAFPPFRVRAFDLPAFALPAFDLPAFHLTAFLPFCLPAFQRSRRRASRLTASGVSRPAARRSNSARAAARFPSCSSTAA